MFNDPKSLKIKFTNQTENLNEELFNILNFSFLTHPNIINSFALSQMVNTSVWVYFDYSDSVVGNTTLLISFSPSQKLLNDPNFFYNLTKYYVNMPEYYMFSEIESQILSFSSNFNQVIEIIAEIVIYLINFIQLGESYGLRSKILTEYYLLIKYLNLNFPPNLKLLFNSKRNNFFLYDLLIGSYSTENYAIENQDQLKKFTASQYFLENSGDLLIRIFIILLISKIFQQIIPLIERNSTPKWKSILKYIFYTFIWNLMILQVVMYFKCLSYFALENILFPTLSTSYGILNVSFASLALLFSIWVLIYLYTIFQKFRSNQISILPQNLTPEKPFQEKITPKSYENQPISLVNPLSTPKAGADFLVQTMFSPDKQNTYQTPKGRENNVLHISPAGDFTASSQKLMRVATLDSTPINNPTIEWKRVPSLQKQESLGDGINSSQRVLIGKNPEEILPVIHENEVNDDICNAINQQIIISTLPDKKMSTPSIEGTPSRRENDDFLKKKASKFSNQKKPRNKSKSPEKYMSPTKKTQGSNKKESPKLFKKTIVAETKQKNIEDIKSRIHSPTKGTQYKLKHMIILQNYQFSQTKVKIYLMLELVRQVLAAMILIGLIKYVLVQMIIINTLNALMMVYLLKVWPFRNQFDNILQVIYEVLINLGCVSLIILTILISQGSQNAEFRTTLGWLVYFSNLSLNMIMILIFSWSCLMLFKKGFSRYKNNRVREENLSQNPPIEGENTKNIINIQNVPCDQDLGNERPISDFLKALKKTRNLMKGIVDDFD